MSPFFSRGGLPSWRTLRRQFDLFDAPCRPLEIGSRQSFHMMVTVSTGAVSCIRLVVESRMGPYTLVGGGTLFGRVLGYFLS